MLITTIFSDASFCPETGAAGYGVYIVSDLGRCEWGGVIMAPVTSAEDAEWCALANAVAIAAVRLLIVREGKLLLQADNQAVMTGLKGPRGFVPRSEFGKLSMAKILDYASLHDCTIETRWVKGHAKEQLPRTYCNKVCDRLAGVAMRQRREFLRSSGVSTAPKPSAGDVLARRQAKAVERAAAKAGGVPFPWEK
jgi:ribonuclease HI